MGKNRKQVARPAPAVSEPTKGPPWALIAGAVAIVGAVGVFVAMGSSSQTPAVTAAEEPTAATDTTQATDATPAATQTGTAPASGTEVIAKVPADLPMPPLPYVPQAAAGPADLMRQAYVFAAQNPDVLGYVPCYCGCGMSDGHQSNVDCFVESRAPNGAVEAWDTHGMT